jgi:hypothetical protein
MGRLRAACARLVPIVGPAVNGNRGRSRNPGRMIWRNFFESAALSANAAAQEEQRHQAATHQR